MTLDQQLVAYWERQAQRFDRLAAQAQWGWIARGYTRKAERSRAKAEVSRLREAGRKNPKHDPSAESTSDAEPSSGSGDAT
ncbi:MAG: hypothetical protein K2Y56_01090 [Methylobacterium sp.]|uniref:hypothetical protein n=1 Tax=Methylobacterium sp. TaxID=409 RepID=UPI0025DF21FF|nr:hypothetical protein [Methylobacterium sp.]MBX9930130.1 hypothetical protein [Methylobacterium sp.]